MSTLNDVADFDSEGLMWRALGTAAHLVQPFVKLKLIVAIGIQILLQVSFVRVYVLTMEIGEDAFQSFLSAAHGLFHEVIVGYLRRRFTVLRERLYTLLIHPLKFFQALSDSLGLEDCLLVRILDVYWLHRVFVE